VKPVTLALTLALTSLFSAVTADDKNKLAPDVAATLEKADELEVLSLDPMKPKDTPKDDFHGYKVLGKTTVKKDDRKAILDALDAGLRGSDGSLADTFNPRLGLRATHDGKSVELVIDFEGRGMQTFAGGKSSGSMPTTAGPQKGFDKILTDAKVPLAAKPEKK
jgi:hypothetical protein